MPDEGKRDLVFVVDDEAVIAETAAMILRLHGFDARAFSDPLAALKAAQIDSPSLLFSDVIMPGLNGFELSTEVIRGCPQCKALLFSGNPGVIENLAKTQSEKGLDILAKPISPMDLVSAIRAKLEA